MCKILLNEKLNGVELYFEGKPAGAVLADLKANGFRWNGKKLCWYAKQNEETLKVANTYSEGLKEVATTSLKKINKIDLFKLTTFTEVEREKNYNTKEIAKEIRSALKARFKFVKFSVTSKDSIRVEIKSAPFEKDSIYLKAITEYVDKLVESYNFCTCYDPYGDYGSSYNFYYFGCKLYDYEQVEATAELIEAMKQFDIKFAEAEELKRVEEEREYQEYLIKMEQEKKESDERQKQVKADKEYINNNVEVVEIDEQDQYYVKNAYFANLNKNNTLDQYKEEVAKGDYYLNTLKVTREIYFKDKKSYNLYINMLLHDFSFIDGTGGSYTDDLRINSMTDYYNMTSEEQKTVEWLLQGIAVYVNDELMFVVDAQGYSYARYVGLIDNTITTVEKEIEYKQVITVEEVEELKVEAEEVTNVFNEVIEKNSLEDWYNTRRKFVKAVKEKDLWLHGSVVQQVQDEKIKSYMYRTLKENDNIKDQFNDGKFIVGEKLTIIREAMIGGASISHIMFNSLEELETGIKMVMSVNGKRGLFETKLNDKDNIIIYKGHLVIPENVLYEDTSNEYFSGTATRYGSYDKAALRAITSHLREKNILPVINTFEPIF